MKHDRIYIRDLLCRCIIGIDDDERTRKQDVIINIILYCDLRRACESDSIDNTVNYRTVEKEIISMLDGSSFFLIEALADEAARICLSHQGVEEVTVTVDKPGALHFARSVAVEITRAREGIDG